MPFATPASTPETIAVHENVFGGFDFAMAHTPPASSDVVVLLWTRHYHVRYADLVAAVTSTPAMTFVEETPVQDPGYPGLVQVQVFRAKNINPGVAPTLHIALDPVWEDGSGHVTAFVETVTGITADPPTIAQQQSAFAVASFPTGSTGALPSTDGLALSACGIRGGEAITYHFRHPVAFTAVAEVGDTSGSKNALGVAQRLIAGSSAALNVTWVARNQADTADQPPLAGALPIVLFYRAKPTGGGSAPTVAITGFAPQNNTAIVAGSGTLTSAAGSPVVYARLTRSGDGAVIERQATVVGSNWSVAFDAADPGVWTPSVTITDANDSASATGATVTIVGLSATMELASTFAVSAIVPSKTVLSVASGAPAELLLFASQDGIPLDGMTVSSTNPAVVSIAGPTDGEGSALVTYGAPGTAQINASWTDPVNGLITRSISVTVNSAAPAAPSNLQAVVLTPTSARLTLQDNSSNETDFAWERSLAPTGPWTQFATTLPNVVTVDDTGAIPGTVNYWRARALGTPPSAYSNVASLTMPPAADTTPPTVSLASSASTVTVAQSITLTATASDESGITQVRFFRGGAPIGSPVTAAPYALSVPLTVADNGSLEFTARAFDPAGNSTLSAPVTVTVAISTGPTIPAAPSGLAASEVTASSLVLSVTNNAPAATQVLLERRVGSASAWQQVDARAVADLPFQQAGLLAATTYAYRARVSDGSSWSGYSAEYSVTTASPSATGLSSVLAAPAILTGVAGGTLSTVLSARDALGSGRPGVTLRLTPDDPEIATVTPSVVVTDADGSAAVVVTFGATVGQTVFTVEASDGQASLTVKPLTAFSIPAFTSAMLAALSKAPIDAKYTEEIIPVVFAFAPMMASGETLIGPPEAVEVVPLGGSQRDPDAEAMRFGLPVVVGTHVLQFMRLGVPGVSYYFRCRCRTSGGKVLVAELRVAVYASIGRRANKDSPIVG